MYSAVLIAVTVACSSEVWSFTVPTTTPPTTTPQQVCNVNGVAVAVGDTYEDKNAGNEMCRIYMCDNPPDAYSHIACYDSTTDKCVSYYSTQMIDGCERVCEPYTGNGGPGWVSQGCDTTTPLTTTPPTTPPPPPPTTPPPQVCYVNGVSFGVGEIYEDKDKSDEMCRVYECGQQGNEQPYAYSHVACYDSILDKCVEFYSTQITGAVYRTCEPYNNNGRPGWQEAVFVGGCTSATEGPQETQPTPPPRPTLPPQPEETTQQGCILSGVHYPYGPIPNSGDCICDNSGYVMCP